MEIPAQCGTTAGRGKYGVEGSEGEMGFAGIIMIMTVEEPMMQTRAARSH